jgi:hypothetical protein
MRREADKKRMNERARDRALKFDKPDYCMVSPMIPEMYEMRKEQILVARQRAKNRRDRYRRCSGYWELDYDWNSMCCDYTSDCDWNSMCCDYTSDNEMEDDWDNYRLYRVESGSYTTILPPTHTTQVIGVTPEPRRPSARVIKWMKKVVLENEFKEETTLQNTRLDRKKRRQERVRKAQQWGRKDIRG